MQCALPSCSEAAKQKCAACKSLGYCSREHQRGDWKTHKKECQRIVTAEAAASGEGAAGGGAPDAAPVGKDAGGGDGGEVAEQPTPVARHDTLRAMMRRTPSTSTRRVADRSDGVRLILPSEGGMNRETRTP